MSSKTKTLDGKTPFVPNYLLAHICISNNSRVFIAGVAQLVEHHLAKVDVEGSNPFARSMNILSGHLTFNSISKFRHTSDNIVVGSIKFNDFCPRSFYDRYKGKYITILQIQVHHKIRFA